VTHGGAQDREHPAFFGFRQSPRVLTFAWAFGYSGNGAKQHDPKLERFDLDQNM
jgi:hypothetical protein